MTRKTASHLKIHSEEGDAQSKGTEVVHRPIDLVDMVGVFSKATGWIPKPIARTPHQDGMRELNSSDVPQIPLRNRVQLISAAPIDGMLDADENMPVTSEDEAWALLEQLDHLVEELRSAETTIELQEAQLASSIGVSVRRDEAEMLNARLIESLERATEQTGSDAGAIYLLDETTSQLKMRSCFGLSKSALSAPARELRGSLADLEALMGNAVLVENTKLAPEWNCPENFAAALCLPIGSPTMPQGTIWLWSSHVRDFEKNDIEIARAASEKILVDIERSVLADEVLKTRGLSRQVEAASMVQASRLPSLQPLHRDYDVAGWTYQGQALGGNFHTWNVNKHERICAALGASVTSGPSGALVATSVQTVVETCWNTKHRPAQVLRKANDILWDVEDGDWRSSLCYLQIHPESGSTDLSVTGDIQAFVVTARGVRMLPSTPSFLAEQPDSAFRNEQLTLEGGELLVVASADVIGGIERGGFSQDALLAMVTEMQEDSVQDLSDHLARMLPMCISDGSDPTTDRSIMLIRRKF
ncbi:MAG: PP2C family protein-serine/threonine phosphatase [Pirellulaceae bacterium]